MRISRKKVAEVLAKHGWRMDQPTVIDKDGEWFKGSDFLSTFGEHETYDARAVARWLGY